MRVLGLFFTRGVSLRQWVASGLFDREVLIYRIYLESGLFDAIRWYTYGSDDAAIAVELHEEGVLPSKITVVPMPGWFAVWGRLASLVYSFLLPFAASGSLRQCGVYKTNQMDGSIAAVIASLLYRRPLHVRTGYTLSSTTARVFPGNLPRKFYAWCTELLAFRFADTTSVTSKHDRDYLIARYSLSRNPPHLVGNYIDVEAFDVVGRTVPNDRLLFVGRLSPEKNLAAAIHACAYARVGIDIVGSGPERDNLKEIANAVGADVRWMGVVPNKQLPQILAQYQFFILPSLWEGMPKALLEAMAAGLVCIGTDISGINELIRDGETGYLSPGHDAKQLAASILRAKADLYSGVGGRARKFVHENFSIRAIADKEAAILGRLMQRGSLSTRGGNG